MSRVLCVGQVRTLMTYEELAERTSDALRVRIQDSRSATKELARMLGCSPSLAEKLRAGERAPSGVQLVNLTNFLGADFMDEIRGIADKDRQAALELLNQLERRIREW